MNLQKTDREIYDLIQKEQGRQEYGLEMIPSENYVSTAVLEAMGSVLTNKYSEGYPKKRYYGGNQFIDEIETLCQDRAKKLFDVPFVNVQPYSGSPANTAVYFAVCQPGDTIMGQDLPHGGHLTHGWKASLSGQLYKSVPYHVKKNGEIDFKETEELAKRYHPKLIWVGSTAYVKLFPFQRMAKIAEAVGAYLVADIAHVAGLVAAGVHPSPAPHADIITSTTHKTLRGPRAGLILVTQKGLKKDPELGEKIDRAVFPGLQGGPHENTIAAIAVCLKEASQPLFIKYAKQIVKNAQTLAQKLMDNGWKLIGDGTENHMILMDLTPLGIGKGVLAQEALEVAGITVNKNTIPGDPSSPFYPSGLRLGTPALTSRAMKELEMKKIALWIGRSLDEIKDHQLPTNKAERQEYLKKFKPEIKKNGNLLTIRAEIKRFCQRFPVPGVGK